MKRFAFLDFDITGLDEQLNELASYETLIRPLGGCAWDETAREMHERSGLALDAAVNGVRLVTVIPWPTERLDEFREPDVDLHLAGNSVHFDRRFLKRYFPAAEALFHHRHLDVSSIRMLAEAAGHPPLTGDKPHRAMADVRRSLEDARRFLEVLK